MQDLVKTFYIFCLLAFNISANQAHSAETAWKTKIDKNNIQIKQLQQGPAFKQQHTKGEMVIKATPAMVFALLNDFPACHKWIFGCMTAEHLDNDMVHVTFAAPLWFKDRDLMVKYAVSYEVDKKQWTVRLVNQASALLDNDYVRINHFSAIWLLTAVNSTQTHVLYEVYIDPEIKLATAVNKYNRDAMFVSLRRMKFQLQQAPYKDQQKLPEELQAVIQQSLTNL